MKNVHIFLGDFTLLNTVYIVYGFLVVIVT